MRETGIVEMTPELVCLPRREREAHKGDFGKVAIVGGCVGYSGAPLLAAEGAVRTGAGLVSVYVPEPVWPVAAVRLSSAMPAPLPADGSGALSAGALPKLREELAGKDAVLMGPGLSRRGAVPEVVRALAEELTVPLVLDADGINALEGHIDVLDRRRGRVTILTPHEGEFARLGGDLSAGDRRGQAGAFAREHGCILVLKGHRTITATPEGRLWENTTGNPGMAKGGSGDVLAGMILALLGQGIPTGEAAAWAVCLHGQAGDLAAEELGEYSMTPGDLIAHIPAVMKGF